MKGNLVIGLLIWLVACASNPPVVERAEARQGQDRVVVFVTGHGWHTGLVVPAHDLQARFPALKKRFGDAPYIEFGWGDLDFYQAEEVTAGVALKAILWPTAAVMHAVAVPTDIRAYFPGSEIQRLCLSQRNYASLIDFIAGSFRPNGKGDVVILGNGLYGDSSFFGATGAYSVFNTCNTWTAKGLKSAGLAIEPATKATAGSVMRFLQQRALPQDDRCPEDGQGPAGAK